MQQLLSKFSLMPEKGFIRNNPSYTLNARLKESESERLKAQDANDAKTEFLAHISHEIRNPAGLMINIANILAGSSPLTQKQKDLINILQVSSESLTALLNDLIDITKIEERRIQLENIPFDLYENMHNIFRMMAPGAREKGLQFTLACEPVKGRIFMGDAMRIWQMTLNLCCNAVKFTDTGSIHMSVTCEKTQENEPVWIKIEIQDTGIGMSAEDQTKIFKKFSQANPKINQKYGGTGLGLAITKNLAEAMGGTVKVQSAPGQGSTFMLCIPLVLRAKSPE